MVITCNCYARKLGRYCFVVEIGEKNDIDIDIPMAAVCSRCMSGVKNLLSAVGFWCTKNTHLLGELPKNDKRYLCMT